MGFGGGGGGGGGGVLKRMILSYFKGANSKTFLRNLSSYFIFVFS